MEFFNLSKKRYLYSQDYALSKISEYLEMGIYSLLAFMLPFVLKHPQLLVGSVVNCALILSALNLKGYKNLPVIVFPSLAVLFAGILFGPLSLFLLYIIPFIWIANGALVFLTKYLIFGKSINRFYAVGISILCKVTILFIATFALFSFGLIPEVLLNAMGIIQLYTALIGGIFALGIQYTKGLIFTKS